MQLAFQSFGSTGEPLIILHGLFGSRENWHSISLELSNWFRVFALDQRNHGESPRAPEMDYRVMADDILEFVAAHGLERAHVLGHSMGAKTAMQFTLKNPGLVLSLVSVDMAPRAYAPRHEDILKGLDSLDLESCQTRHQMEQALAPWVPDLATRRFLLKNARSSAKGFYWRLGLREIGANYSRLNQAVLGMPFSGRALFIRGQNSDYIGDDDVTHIQRLFPKAQTCTVPAAGHLVHVDNPRAFLQQVLEFLTKR